MSELKYPIGIQSFEKIRNDGYLYVDKTRYVYHLTRHSECFFLSRPRRFGKSMLLSTLEAFFSGKKDLFKGLAIYELEKEWVSYPVLHFDLSGIEASALEKVEDFIKNRLREYENLYSLPNHEQVKSVGDRFGMLIKGIAESTGKRVVILIDEYDKGLIEVLEDQDRLNANQDLLRTFFTQLKSKDAYIRFSMLTGVARFRHLTLFSGLNNPKDISLSAQYAAVCGLTKSELLSTFADGIKAFSDKLQLSDAELVELLRQKYDSYRFSDSGETVYNPFSILNCLEDQKLDNYWVMSGTTKTFISFLEKTDFNIADLEDEWVTTERLSSVFSSVDPVSLLYQTGYLTIKDYDDGLYRLGIPNAEVRKTFVDELAPKYMGIEKSKLPNLLRILKRDINGGNIDGFMEQLRSLISKVPYHQLDLNNLEKTYHLIIYQIFLILGIDANSEISMSGGRIDMVATTKKYVYVMEFKLGGTTDEALRQIEDKGYAIPWSTDGRKVFKVGIVFSPRTHTIEGWSVVNDM